MCFRRTDRWMLRQTRERPEDELTYLVDEELRTPDRPVPVAEREPDQGEPAEEREPVPAGLDG